MVTQIVMDHTGHSRHEYDVDDIEALTKAERRFRKLTSEGFTAAVRTAAGESWRVFALPRKRHCSSGASLVDRRVSPCCYSADEQLKVRDVVRCGSCIIALSAKIHLKRKDGRFCCNG